MSNPIFDLNFNNSNNRHPNSWEDMINQVKSSPNPDAVMQSILLTNPQFHNILNYINQNGGDAKTAFYNMAAQKGVDPNSILSRLK